MKRTRIFFASVGGPQHYNQHNPPIGLLYLAAWLREKFPLEIRVVSQRVDRLGCDALVELIRDFKPDIVGLSSMTPQAHFLPDIVGGIKDSMPEVLVVLGGPHVSAVREAALSETNADLAVAGEGERSMEQIVSAWISGSDMSSIPGLMRRTIEGLVVTNPGSPPMIEDLDTLPFPAYDLIDIQKYWSLNSQMLLPYPRKYIMLFTSRGCPYGCTYCHSIFGRRVRMYSAERMVEEIRHFSKSYNMDEVLFYEDCFNANRKRVLDFSSLLLKEHGPIKIVFPNGMRADILDEEVIDALVQAGTYQSSLALETGSPRLQKFIEKNLDIHKFLQTVKMFTDRRVFTHAFAMMGFPTETESELKETIRVASESRLHTAEFYTVIPFPNTALSTYVKEHSPEKLSGISFANEEYWHSRTNLSAIPDELLFYYQRKAYGQFYFKPGRLYRILRDYPKPAYLPSRIPEIVYRMSKRG